MNLFQTKPFKNLSAILPEAFAEDQELEKEEKLLQLSDT